jgi:hypothetical protein
MTDKPDLNVSKSEPTEVASPLECERLLGTPHEQHSRLPEDPPGTCWSAPPPKKVVVEDTDDWSVSRHLGWALIGSHDLTWDIWRYLPSAREEEMVVWGRVEFTEDPDARYGIRLVGKRRSDGVLVRCSVSASRTAKEALKAKHRLLRGPRR